MKIVFVRGSSMFPVIKTGDILLFSTSKYQYTKDQITRSEIVLLKTKNSSKSLLIKRIIGLPGDNVQAKNGQIFIEGIKFAELSINDSYSSKEIEKSWKLTKNRYFVCGDFREYSTDSRHFGPILFEQIVGRFPMRIWPIFKIGYIG